MKIALIKGSATVYKFYEMLKKKNFGEKILVLDYSVSKI